MVNSVAVFLRKYIFAIRCFICYILIALRALPSTYPILENFREVALFPKKRGGRRIWDKGNLKPPLYFALYLPANTSRGLSRACAET